MARSYIGFIKSNAKDLSFGAMLFFLSTFGHTYFIAFFIDEFMIAYDVTSGTLGAVFAIVTVSAALALPWLGAKLDTAGIYPYTSVIAIAFSASCFILALDVNFVLFVVGLFLLRLCGQGLLIHTAVVATSRALPVDSGKAISIVNLGSSIPRVVIPTFTVFVLSVLSWQQVWFVLGCAILFGAGLAVLFHSTRGPKRADPPISSPNEKKRGLDTHILLDIRFLLSCPALLAVSYIWTGFLFHQTILVSEKGWTTEWFAASFAAFAVVQMLGSLVAGAALDRLGVVRIIAVFLVPQALGLLLIVAFSDPWAAPAFLVLTAISAAIDIPLAAAILLRLFSVHHLGRARSSFEGLRILVTGASPFVMGVLLDQGISLSEQALGCAAYAISAGILAFVVQKRCSVPASGQTG
jgi:MFS family permease